MHPVPRLVICSGNKRKNLGQSVLFIIQIALLAFSFHFQTSVTVRFVTILSADLHRITDKNGACEYQVGCLIDASDSSDALLSFEYKVAAPGALFLYILIPGDQS